MQTDKYFIVARVEKQTGDIVLCYYDWRERNGKVDFWVECYDRIHEHAQVSSDYYRKQPRPVPAEKTAEARQIFENYCVQDDALDWV